MSKKAKNSAKERRLKEKKGRKMANAAQYAAWAASGSNSRKKSRKAQDGIIAGHPCGNIGCLRCSKVALFAKVRLRAMSHGKKAKVRHVTRFGEVEYYDISCWG